MLLSELARLIDGVLDGADGSVDGVTALDAARPGMVTFVFKRKMEDVARSSEAAAFIVAGGVTVDGRPVIRVRNTQLAMARTIAAFNPPHREAPGIASRASVAGGAHVDGTASVLDFAYVAEGAVIGPGATIHPFAYVGRNAEIGDGATVMPHAVVLDGVNVGKDCVIGPGAVIGKGGFGYVFDGKRHVPIPQVGTVSIGDDVHVGANTTIDRATLDVTRIGAGTRIDNQVQVAHNVQIGRNCIIVSQSGIAGSATLGDGVVLAGQCAVADHAVVGDGVMAGGRTGILSTAEPGSKLMGNLSMEYRRWFRLQAILAELPDVWGRIKELIGTREQGG